MRFSTRVLKCSLLLAGLLSLLVAAPAPAKLLYVGDKGVATVGKVACKGTPGCQLNTPKRVQAKIGQKSYWTQVQAPKRIAAGKKATVKVKIGAKALAELAGRTTTVEVEAVVKQGEEKARTKPLKVRLRRAALADQPQAPKSGPLGSEPPLLARPATAVDVSSVQVTWYPRDSWVRYVSQAQGMFFADGATGVQSTESECPDVPAPQPPPGLPFRVDFLPRPSWYDPVSGAAGIYGQGTVQFLYASRGINFTTSDPEVEINGGASRMIFRLAGSEGTAMPSQRSPFLNLELSGPPAVVGKTHTYSFVRGKLADDGTNVFASFYPPAAPFGCVSVSFITP
jgi:Htaa